MSRDRTRYESGRQGVAIRYYNSGTMYDYSESRDVHRCVDSFGVRDSAFDAFHHYAANPIAGVTPPDVYPRSELRDWIPGYLRDTTHLGHLPDDSVPLPNSAAVDVLKATNPSKPSVDLPVSLFELRELPSLVRRVGYSRLKRAAELNIKYEFGVKPVISDLFSLLDFTENVEKTVKILSDLKKGPLVRKATVGNFSVQNSPNETIALNSSGNFYFGGVHTLTMTNRKVWGYVTWTPDAAALAAELGDRDKMRKLAYNIVLGTRVDFVTMWNALPWSWLVDWFSNVGDWLEANRSYVSAYPGNPSICTTTVTEYVFRSGNNDFGFPPGQFSLNARLVSKSRRKGSAIFPSADMPLLSGRQVGILSSLAALRSR